MNPSENTTSNVKNIDRITELARLKLHEDQIDEILNEYAQKAAEEFDLPIGLVSIVLDDVQKFAAAHGTGGWIGEVNGTPVEWAFCANSVESGQPFIVEDADTHEKMKNTPLVTMDNVKCYAGAPMVTSNGFVIGNFCVIGDKSRSFKEEEVTRLKEYAKLATERIESRIA